MGLVGIGLVELLHLEQTRSLFEIGDGELELVVFLVHIGDLAVYLCSLTLRRDLPRQTCRS